MKKLVLLGLLLSLTSCVESGGTYTQDVDGTVRGYSSRLYILDGCEYIVIGSFNCQMMSHKGNCKNCAERNLKHK